MAAVFIRDEKNPIQSTLQEKEMFNTYKERETTVGWVAG